MLSILWLKTFHLIFVVTWFAGLFYLPRLFVYHAQILETLPHDVFGHERFCIMERKLFWGIMTPSAVLALIFGLAVWHAYGLAAFQNTAWLHLKLLLVAILIGYHLYCLHYLQTFRKNTLAHGHVFFRWFNEIPVVLLIIIVILVIVKPF